MKVLLVIPAYNEDANIINTCRTIDDYNKKNKTCYDYVVINDGSVDNTGVLLDKEKINHIDLIHNLGIGGAVQTGYKYAKKYNYDIVVQFDGDGQHDIRYVENIIKPIMNDEYDMVIGSRFIGDVSEFKTTGSRRFGIKIISFFIKLVTGMKVYDTTSGFRAVNRKVINEFALEYPIEFPEPITTVELVKKKFRIKEVAVNMKKRTGGKSSIHTWKNFYYMINVVLSILVIGIRRYK